MLQCKSMQKQFASSNTFVLRQTLSISSCDGLCTDQNDTAASVHLRDDIAVVCSKLSQTSQYQTSNAKQVVPSNAMERSDLSITTAQRTPVRSLHLTHIDAQHLAILSYDHTLVHWWCKSKSPGGEISQPRRNYAADFLWQQLTFGHKHAATPQISPTRKDFLVLARCDAGWGQNAAVGLFMRSVCFVVRSPHNGVNTRDQTEYANSFDGNATSCF